MEEQLQTVRGVSTEEVHRFETLFKLFDEDGSGCISISELADLMPRLGIFLSEDELQVLFHAVDSDGSGDIDFNEFLALMVRQREANQLALLESGERLSFSTLEEGQSVPQWKLWPDSVRTVAWEFMVLGALLFFLCVVLLEDVSSEPPGVAARVPFAIVLLADVYMRAAVIAVVDGANDDCIEWSTPGILRRYLRSPWWVIDVAGALPLDLILMAADNRRSALWVSHLRLVKILRVPTFFPVKSRELMTPMYARVHFAVVPMFRMLFWALASIHVLAVAWMAVSPDPDPEQEDDPPKPDYLEACYFVLYTLTTVGYGDVSVGTPNQKAFALFLFLCSTCVTGLVVGKLVQWSQQADLNENTYRTMLETLAVLSHLRVPEDFKREILALQYHRLRTSFSLYETTIAGMPLAMRDRMMLYARMKIVRHVPIFSTQDDICLAKLAMALVNVMVPPEEFVIIAGEEGSEMFFLFHGMCDVYLANGQRVAVIRRGGIFGEIALLQATRRAASIRSLTYCQLFRLDKTAFDDITLAFHSLRQAIEDEMHRRSADKPKPTPQPAADHADEAERSSAGGSNAGVSTPLAADREKLSAGPMLCVQPPDLPAQLEEPTPAKSARAHRHNYLVSGGSMRVPSPTSGGRVDLPEITTTPERERDSPAELFLSMPPLPPAPLPPAPPLPSAVAAPPQNQYEVQGVSNGDVPWAVETGSEEGNSERQTSDVPTAVRGNQAVAQAIVLGAHVGPPRAGRATGEQGEGAQNATADKAVKISEDVALTLDNPVSAAPRVRRKSIAEDLKAWSDSRPKRARGQSTAVRPITLPCDDSALTGQLESVSTRVAGVAATVTAAQQALEARLWQIERAGFAQMDLLKSIKEAVDGLERPSAPPSPVQQRSPSMGPVQSPKGKLGTQMLKGLSPPQREASTSSKDGGLKKAGSSANLGRDGAGAASALLVHGRMKRTPSDVRALAEAGKEGAKGDGERNPTPPTTPRTPRGGRPTLPGSSAS
eukprot:TRINITY_DN17697_c0_g1_i2.p1 TRINITY_DN17697_c0_g1~~TRINITY_DN17697_c0_g1_i2.p1  ORF type:complete len:1000 (+),score=291.23 TRINITY_DN17697_c0_g1_i2:200-3199(+)